MMGSAEGKLLVPATEFTTENCPERRPAQCESASSTVVPKAPPTGLFCLVEPIQCSRFAGRIRRQTDVQDRSLANFPERTPPALGN